MLSSSATVDREWEWDERESFTPVVRLSGRKERLADLADDELLEVAKAARRHASWAQARELAAIAELHRRRTVAENGEPLDQRFLSAHESVTEEVAVALMVTGNAAATLVHLAERLTGPLAATGAALEAGRIDLARARVICDTTDGLPVQAAALVEAAALEKASDQTTGQLRRRIKRIAQRLAPESIEERKREAVRRRRMELWETPSGTADLALCDLAVEDAHAVYNKITAAAHGLRAEGDTRPVSTIRADLALQLLHGTELPDATRAVLSQACTDSGPTVSGPMASVRAVSGPTDSGPMASVRAVSGPAASGPMASVRAVSGPTVSGRTGSGRIGSGRIGSGRIGSGRIGHESTCSGRTDSGRTGSELTGPGRIGSGGIDRESTGSGHTGSGPTGFEPPGIGTPDREAPGREAPGREAPGREAPGREAPGREAPGREAPGSESTGSQSTGRGPTGSELASFEHVGVEVTGVAPAGAEPEGDETSGVEFSGSEVSGAAVVGAWPGSGRGGRGLGAHLDDGDVDPEVASLADVVGGLLGDASERARPGDRHIAVGRAAQRLQQRLAGARDMACQGEQPTHGRPGYRPPAGIRREVEARHATCVFPTCNQPSHRCDLDHTVPWRPGITCRCNLAPLCRRHHRLKQRHDWKLFQIWPGLLIWVTPSGAWRIVRPDRQ